MEAFYGILIPFLGTALGAACVFFMKKALSDAVQRSLTGFAAGVMVAASVWSLLIPAIEQSAGMGKLSFLPAFLGFWLGILFLLALDHIIPHLHANSAQAEGPKSRLQRTTMMVLAVTLHNIPEGMAVGLAFALAADGESLAGAFALALGIGVQNFPEGAAVALPLLEKKLHGFAAPDAVLTAVETRSSSPVRIVRDNTYQTALRGLYPCGEGAGYAGGILSAAADGMRCAEQIIKEITQHG